MKKLSVMVMAGVMALGMVGCGSTAAEAPAESTAPAAESTAAETTESTAEALLHGIGTGRIAHGRIRTHSGTSIGKIVYVALADNRYKSKAGIIADPMLFKVTHDAAASLQPIGRAASQDNRMDRRRGCRR